MKQRSLLRALACYYPKSLREPGDFGGLMAGRIPNDVHKILLCLDFDDEVWDLAARERPDLILTHHPFIFGTPAKVLKADPIKKALYKKIIANGFCVYSIHTNFDAGTPGMNDALVAALQLQNVRHLEGSTMARGGDLPAPMEVHDFARYAKNKLGVSYGLLIAKGKPTVQSVAIIGGGGWFENELAQKLGYDIYISGDMPHHGRREVVLRHYNYLDLPHEIEHVYMAQMKKTLLLIDPTLEIVTVDHEQLPEVI
ncbi:MAG: putative GTP cyclohydrolase 1 type 2 [Tenericutes bacterium ADurb.BinA155]|jgi:dinuclear metal center YbgI/SA1388 family protein|nr:MAG: putative GTP cyclohydrolase 1 type 2 [Tenericutes bacterium ADurb.BinA155]